MLLSQAQKYDIPLNYNLSQEILQVKSSKDSLFHSGIKPFNQWYLSQETFDNSFRDTGEYYYDVTVLMYQKHLLEIHQKDVHLGMDVLLNLGIGRRWYNEQGNAFNRVSTNTRGFRIVANVGKNISFETRFYENQFFYPNYIDSIAHRRNIALGVGRVKSFKNNGWDVGNSMGTVSFRISDQLNMKFGHDKIFIGHGYRSLLLSDNASNYPHLSLHFRSKNNKWQYMSSMAWMQSLARSETTVSTEALFKRKNASIHYLSFKPNNRLEFGLFESTIYKRFDDSLGFVAPHASFYNPIIGVNTVINGLQGVNNSVIGFSAAYSQGDLQFFTQLAMDDTDKFGFQLGGKWFSPFGLDRNWLQLEFNTVPSYMYSHTEENLYQSYSHMNQELAHPIGASFSEVAVLYHFEKNRWFSNVQFSYTHRVRGGTRQLGENILQPSDDPLIANVAFQNANTYYWNVEGGYNINIKTRLQLFGQASQRVLQNLLYSERSQNDFFIVLGMRCNLTNTYFDL